MADRLTSEQRSRNMKRIKCKDSKIETLLRKALWKKGIRYKKNVNSIYGHPDIALPGLKIAVFCDSEFWHGYNWDKRKNDIKSNRDFWIPKIERNIQRDREVTEELLSQGWIVLRFWGKDIEKNTENCVESVIQAINERRCAR